MAYKKTEWINGETPVNADNLNNIEQGIEGAHKAIEKHIEELTTTGRSLNAATTPEEALLLLGGVKISLLWENPSPDSSMEAQVLTLPDLSDYDHLLMIAKDFVDPNVISNNYQSAIIPNIVGMGHQFVYIGYACDYKYRRDVSVLSENEITIDNGYKAGVIDNAECVPYRIYGIKGVK